MEDTLVSYDTALLAKKVGFDEECNSVYNKSLRKETLYYYEGNGTGVIKNSDVQNTSTGVVYLCTAPTQSFLSKWLRVKYNYNINIKHITHNQKYGFSVTGNYDEKTGGIIIPYNFKGYDSYEGCLEDALQQCLNIIKNDINNRQNSSK